jgi:hypothetical protein
MKTSAWLISGLFLAMLLGGCNKTAQQNTEDELFTIVDDEIIDLKFAEATDEDVESGLALEAGGGFADRIRYRRFLSDCVTVTVSGETFPKEIILDYGEGCLNRRGITISGKVIITLSDRMNVAGAIHKVVYQNVKIDDRKVDLTRTTTNNGLNEAGNWVITSLLERTVTYEDNSGSTRTASFTTEWVSGFGTPEKTDDVFYRSGSGGITTTDGLVYSRTITTPLLFDRSCLFIKSGVVEIVRGETDITIDFGSGDCDRWATVTIDGVSKEVDLGKRTPRWGFGPRGR